jgi:hypothetical protein
MSRLTHSDVIAIVGALDDPRIAEIIATGATAAEVTEAFEWLNRGGEMGEELQRSLHGTAALVFDILKRDEPPTPGED